ncbi:TetR-like C-terminal domain-containing protein [Rhizomicrobium electricum]|uniref:TetR-like C-terminal domain-containing protein n=1 Tax=Rhizomicrobium electricum TaxID=480070 RepID=UPI00142171DB
MVSSLNAGEVYVYFALGNPALYRLMFGEGLSRSSKKACAVRSLQRTALEKTKSHLGSRMNEPAPTHTSFFLWSQAHGLSLLLIGRHANE